jgi:hypothetical protein
MTWILSTLEVHCVTIQVQELDPKQFNCAESPHLVADPSLTGGSFASVVSTIFLSALCGRREQSGRGGLGGDALHVTFVKSIYRKLPFDIGGRISRMDWGQIDKFSLAKFCHQLEMEYNEGIGASFMFFWLYPIFSVQVWLVAPTDAWQSQPN